jgi:hypothetical protein
MSAATIQFPNRTAPRKIHFSEAGLTRLENERGVLTFRPGARNLPRGGEIIEFVAADGRYRLEVVAEATSRRNHSRFQRAYVTFSPRRLVKILAVERCATCSGSGAVEIPGPCPECRGRGCADCDDSGRLEFSDCPTCHGRG